MRETEGAKTSVHLQKNNRKSSFLIPKHFHSGLSCISPFISLSSFHIFSLLSPCPPFPSLYPFILMALYFENYLVIIRFLNSEVIVHLYFITLSYSYLLLLNELHECYLIVPVYKSGKYLSCLIFYTHTLFLISMN